MLSANSNITAAHMSELVTSEGKTGEGMKQQKQTQVTHACVHPAASSEEELSHLNPLVKH